METIISLNQENELYDVNDKSVQGLIKSLNKKGIYTVQDYLDCPKEKLPFKGKEPIYTAIREILRHKYQGGDFSFDKILSKEYNFPVLEHEPVRTSAIWNIKWDLQKLGFTIHPLDETDKKIDYSENKYRGKYVGENAIEVFLNNGIESNRLPNAIASNKIITMDQLLKYFHGIEEPKGIHLREYYLKYIEKKMKDDPNYVSLETVRYIDYLNEQMPKLIQRSKEISVAIEGIEAKIQRLELIKDRAPNLSEDSEKHLVTFKKQVESLKKEKEQIDKDIEGAKKRIDKTEKQETIENEEPTDEEQKRKEL